MEHMMVNKAAADDDNLMTSSSINHQRNHQNFMCSIQNPSSHTEEVSGIMWVELLSLS